jgi:hypothetical protein
MTYVVGGEEITECAFEPDSVVIRCMDCNKPTGKTGTCKDVDLCTSCRADYIDAAMAHGDSRKAAEREVSAMIINAIEGGGFKPACGIRGGPHPLTDNPNESNCKRCIKHQG